MTIPFSLDRELPSLWPQTCIGLIEQTIVVQEETAAIWDFFAQNLKERLVRDLEQQALTDMPGIADARCALRAFGIDPGRWRISSEALYRRVRQGKDIYQINSVVDCNNLVSLATGLSLGSYDLDCLQGDIVLRLGTEGESYPAIGKGDLKLAHMPLLADALGPFGSPVSDSSRSMVTLQTRRVLTVLYGFSGAEMLEQSLALAKEWFARFCASDDMQTRIVA